MFEDDELFVSTNLSEIPKCWDNPEWIKNRADKSVLYVATYYPDKILNKYVINFEEVKFLYINCDINEDIDTRNSKENNCKGHYHFLETEIYRTTFFNIITKFKNLETLELYAVYMNDEVYMNIAENVPLKKLIIEFGGFDDFESFNDQVFEKLIKIPSLETFCLKKYYLNNFPKGPSNIKQLCLQHCYYDGTKLKENDDIIKKTFKEKLKTYKNLEIINISFFDENDVKWCLENFPNIDKNYYE